MAEIVPTINQQIQRIPQGEQFKPTHKVLKRIVPKAKTKSATHPVVMKPEKELFLFTFPEDFDLESIKGAELKLKDGKTFEAKGKTYTLTGVPTSEYGKFVPVFAASSTESSAWLAGKPFQGAFSVAESTVADAESIEKAELGKAPAVTKDAKKVMAASFKLTMDDPILGNDPVVKRVDPNKLKRYWSAVGSKRKFDDIKEKPIKEKRKSKKSKKN